MVLKPNNALALSQTLLFCHDIFVGNYYEVTDGVVTKYYFAGSQRIATLAPHASAGVRKNGTLYFILGDHLGSTSPVTSASGLVVRQTMYKACPQGASQGGSQASVWNTADKLHLHGTIQLCRGFRLDVLQRPLV